jgi:hypothetical protein
MPENDESPFPCECAECGKDIETKTGSMTTTMRKTTMAERKTHTIRLFFKTLAQAERYQWKLYELWEQVEGTGGPLFSEAGYYSWKVGGRKA